MREPTAEEKQELKRALETLAEELEELVAATTEGSKPVDLDQPIGRLSRMDAIQQQQLTKANRASHVARLERVRAALAAFEDDTYGECRRCEEPISHARLEARPEAALCVECQEALER